MNREKAAHILDGLAECLDIQDIKDWRDAVDALLLGAAALRGHQPDPKTGLVPCGCGGKAEFAGCSGDADYYSVICAECAIDTDSYALKEDAKTAWNRAMGVKEADE
jgi:hypothetical protein